MYGEEEIMNETRQDEKKSASPETKLKIIIPHAEYLRI